MADDQKLIDAANKVGEYPLGLAFKKSVFVYGTQGSGSIIVKGLKAWAGRARSTTPQQGRIQRVIERDLNLFDPGRRAQVYLAGDYQMMDLYYGQAGTGMHEKRNPLIAEFVHYAMGFKHGFSMSQSGRDAFVHTFGKQLQTTGQDGKPKTIEGWESNGPSYGGLTATKEISRIIRWGIHHFGGKLIFEGKEVYYSQVFNANAPRVGDTDLEARELFKFFSPGMSTVRFGKGKVVFQWNGQETVPTHVHFLSNWQWSQNKTHTPGNLTDGKSLKAITFLPIWNNFSALPIALLGSNESEVLAALAPFIS